MKYPKIVKNFVIEDNIIDCDYSYRGGKVKVNVHNVFPKVDEPVMGASQNYLGGGMRGAVCGGAMFDPNELNAKDKKVFFALKDKIKRYFHDLTNSDELEMNDEWNTMSYEKNQSLPASAY
jgi:hypothetical protein